MSIISKERTEKDLVRDRGADDSSGNKEKGATKEDPSVDDDDNSTQQFLSYRLVRGVGFSIGVLQTSHPKALLFLT